MSPGSVCPSPVRLSPGEEEQCSSRRRLAWGPQTQLRLEAVWGAGGAIPQKPQGPGTLMPLETRARDNWKREGMKFDTGPGTWQGFWSRAGETQVQAGVQATQLLQRRSSTDSTNDKATRERRLWPRGCCSWNARASVRKHAHPNARPSQQTPTGSKVKGHLERVEIRVCKNG